jgi:hypothetical protein
MANSGKQRIMKRAAKWLKAELYQRIFCSVSAMWRCQLAAKAYGMLWHQRISRHQLANENISRRNIIGSHRNG